jgi:hypothetical protein
MRTHKGSRFIYDLGCRYQLELHVNESGLLAKLNLDCVRDARLTEYLVHNRKLHCFSFHFHATSSKRNGKSRRMPAPPRIYPRSLPPRDWDIIYLATVRAAPLANANIEQL